MSQFQLFHSERAGPVRREPDTAYIRKSLHRLLRLVRDAQIMPWSEGEAESREKLFPQLAAFLPVEESVVLVAEFKSEIIRLRSMPAGCRR